MQQVATLKTLSRLNSGASFVFFGDAILGMYSTLPTVNMKTKSPGISRVPGKFIYLTDQNHSFKLKTVLVLIIVEIHQKYDCRCAICF